MRSSAAARRQNAANPRDIRNSSALLRRRYDAKQRIRLQELGAVLPLLGIVRGVLQLAMHVNGHETDAVIRELRE